MKIVFDTNIIIDALAEREPFAAAAKSLIFAVAEGKADGFITTNTVTDIYYLLRKHYSDAQTARAKMETLFAVIGILEISRSDCTNAIRHPMSDFEDAVLALCAERASADFIATRNPKDFAASPVPPKSPAELLALLDE